MAKKTRRRNKKAFVFKLKRVVKFVAVNVSEWDNWCIGQRHQYPHSDPQYHVRVILSDATTSSDPKYWHVSVSVWDHDDYSMGFSIRIDPDRSNYEEAIARCEAIYNSIGMNITQEELFSMGFKY